MSCERKGVQLGPETLLERLKLWGSQTQVPWCAGGRAFRFFKDWDLSLKSDAFCWEMSISALATMIPKRGEMGNVRKSIEEHFRASFLMSEQHFALLNWNQRKTKSVPIINANTFFVSYILFFSHKATLFFSVSETGCFKAFTF